MNNIKNYAFPRTVKEALTLLLNKKYKAMAIAGGTLTAKTLPPAVETCLHLKNLPIKAIRISGGNLVIGAGASFDEIDKSNICQNWAGGVIAASAAKCSTQLVRNMATIGGNIARPHSFNIFPVVMLGLDARVRVVSGKGEKTADFQDLYAPGFGLRPGLDCLITELIVPAKTRNWKCEFIKLAKTESSWESYLLLFFAAQMKGKTIEQARVSVGALSPRPFRAMAAEKELKGLCAGPRCAGPAAAAFALDLDAARAGDYRSHAACSLLGRFAAGLLK